MKILIVCSTSFYDKIEKIKKQLEDKYEVILPNCYDEPVTNEDNKKMTEEEYYAFFKKMYYESRDKIKDVDAILVLNYSKIKNNIEYKNYIGASTFLEMYEAFMQNKKIYILNDYPDNMLYDEIKGFNPIVLNGNIDLLT
jgi:hypothetical protein